MDDPKDVEPGGTDEKKSFWSGAISSPGEQRLRFALLTALAVFTTGAAVLKGPAVVVAVVLTFLLAGYALFLTSRSVLTHSRDEAKHISSLLNRKQAAKRLLEGIAEPDSETYIVYSSHPLKRFRDPHGHKIAYPHDDRERTVTTFVDAQGVADIQSLLHEVGKTRAKIHPETKFWSDDWPRQTGIFIGSPLANPATADVLERFGCPFLFDETWCKEPDGTRAVVPQLVGDGHRWPDNPIKPDLDYGLLAKFKDPVVEGPVFIVAAGVGSYGTREYCAYLHERLTELADEFGDFPFACVLSLRRTGHGVNRIATAVNRGGGWILERTANAPDVAVLHGASDKGKKSVNKSRRSDVASYFAKRR